MLSLEPVVKNRTGNEEVAVMKVGFVQVWMEMRKARDVRVRLVENIV